MDTIKELQLQVTERLRSWVRWAERHFMKSKDDTPRASLQPVPPRQPQPLAPSEPSHASSGFLRRENYLGSSFVIKGELTGTEDLIIDGRVEGRIEIANHSLIIGPNGKIEGDIYAKNVTVTGTVIGNISAEDMVEIKSVGSLIGDIRSSRISIADSARFKGSVEMVKTTSEAEEAKSKSAKAGQN